MKDHIITLITLVIKALRVKYFLFIFFFVLNGVVSESEASNPLPKPFLFKVSKDGITSYLFGSIHLGISFKELPEPVFKALDQSPIFIAETLFTQKATKSQDENDDKNDTDLANSPFLPTEPTKQQLLQRGIPSAVVNSPSTNLCLWYAALEPLLTLSEEGGIIDQLLEERALQAGKQIRQLDQDTAQKAKIGKKVSSQCDINHYVSSTSVSEAKGSIDSIISKYRNGDLSDFSDSDNSTTATQVLERNQNWIPQLLSPLQKGAFVVVGAGHLGGSHGLISLLSKEGFIIERISLK